MDTLEIIHPGSLTTVQDLGRNGYQQYGVPVSGAIDSYALRLGNLLVGNSEGLPSLEVTLFGCRLRFLADATIAITGADLSPTLDGKPVDMWNCTTVKRGGILAFSRLKSGCRAYLAVGGGISVPVVMGSAATYVRGHIGGFQGRALRAGDVIRTIRFEGSIPVARIPSGYIPNYASNKIELRVTLGPQDDYFTDNGIRTFLNSAYTVSTQADRMGYRLNGPRIQHRAGADIITDGIPLGAVQVPGDGLPIILLADRQTTGGYTKIATVISPDIPLLAQAKPGDEVAFRKVTQDEAFLALQAYEQRIQQLAKLLGPDTVRFDNV
ncbi:MAG: biotin-dependent carboxyltransferase [Chloroflexi bacterium]|nr:biotin-dependent carboxyltransferase [Chloroflexota bacterium]